MQRLLLTFLSFIFALAPSFAFAQPEADFSFEYIRGEVTGSKEDSEGHILFSVTLSSGVSVWVDSYGEVLSPGDRVYVEHYPQEDIYNYITLDRGSSILLITVLFVILILIMSRKKGVRSLLALLVSFLLLIFVMIPLLMQGYDPILIALGFGLCVLFLSIFVTHGFNAHSSVSFLGSFIAIVVAFLVMKGVIAMTTITGIVDEHTQYLAFDREGVVDFVRLYMAAVIIGTLGVLDDISITQVSVVRELASSTTLSLAQIFKRALRVGQDHISSLVNTLIFAYVGATLPLVMFITLLEIPPLVLISQEFIFLEIIRSLVGAIALVIAVPVTTWLAVYVFLPRLEESEGELHACAHRH